MDIICDSCKGKFRISDNKIPADKVAKVRCPKCKNKISIGPRSAGTPDMSEAFAAFTGEAYDASEKPFDFIEEEGKTALVCETETPLKKKITDDLNLMEYHITETHSGREALKKMRYHNYDLIVVDETFNCNSAKENVILLYLERLNMALRRNIFVTLVSRNFRTMDQMAAFRYSVNLIINHINVTDFGKILSRAITDHDMFYRNYIDALKDSGRA